jgi:hypothetical protein
MWWTEVNVQEKKNRNVQTFAVVSGIYLAAMFEVHRSK